MDLRRASDKAQTYAAVDQSNNLLVALASLPLSVSSGNNSTAQLAAGASFIGAIETVANSQSTQILVRCGKAYSCTIDSFIDAAGLAQVGSIKFYKTAGDPTSTCYDLPGSYFRLTVKNEDSSTTTDLNVQTTFGTMPSTDDTGRQVVAEPSISSITALVVGTAAKEGRQLQIVCTVAGNVAVTFPDGSINTIPVGAGLTTLPWAVVKINTSGTTATATYANLR